MSTTFQNSAQLFLIGLFLTLLIFRLSSSLSTNLFHGLVAHGLPVAQAAHASHLPPIATLFAAFLGVNPIEHLLGASTLAQLSSAQRATLLGHSFFPTLIGSSFRAGLHAALDFAIVASLLAAAASWVRGAKEDEPAARVTHDAVDTVDVIITD